MNAIAFFARHLAALCGAFLLCWLPATAQVVELQEIEGVPDPFVYALEFDQKGYLWAGTGSGAFRYSGSEYSAVTTAAGLSENFTVALCRQGNNMIAGHFTGKLSVNKGDNGWAATGDTANASVVTLVAMPNHQVLVVPQNGQLFLVDSLGNRQRGSTVLPEAAFGAVRCALALGGGRVLLGTTTGLLRVTVDGPSMRVQRSKAVPESVQITCLAALGDGQLLAGTQRNGLLRLSQAGNDWSALQLYADGFTFRALAQTPDGYWWAGLGNDLVKFRLTADSAFLLHRITRVHGFPETVVQALKADAEGNLWIGTRGAGLWRLPNNYFSLLRGPEVLALAPGHNSTLYVGTYEGVYELQISQHAVRSENLFPTSQAVSAVVSSEGGFVYGTRFGQLYLVEDGHTTNLDPEGRLSGYPITHLAFDGLGKLWVSTVGLGVARFDSETGFMGFFNTRNGLLHNDVQQVHFDRSNTAWFVTQGTGLASWKNEQFTYYDSDNGLFFPDFTSIVNGPQQRLWLTTAGGGLFMQSDTGFVNYNTTTGLPSNQYRGMVFTGPETGWLVSAYQLYKFDATSGTGFPYDFVPENLEVEFTQGALVALPNRMIAFGTNSGLALLHLGYENAKPTAKADITAIRVNGVPTNPNKALVLGYDASHHMEFEFGSVCLSEPGAVRYSYMLEGLHTGWSDARLSPNVVFSGLDFGEYRFLVRTALPGQDFSEPVGYSFTILAPIWRRWWFISLVIIVLVAGTLGIVRFREAQLRREKYMLETQVRERTRELEEQKDQLQQFTYAISHDLKNPVLNISGLTDVLSELLPSKDEETEEVLSMLGSNARHLQNNLASLMSVLKAQGGIEKHWERIDLEQMVDDVKATLAILIQENEATIRTDFPTARHVVYPREDLQSILYNLISNGIKYKAEGRKPEIVISSDQRANSVIVRVQDNGMGIDLAKYGNRLFGIFKRIHHHVEGSGVGLHLIKSVIEKNGGTISVDSALDAGSTFSVEIPTMRPGANKPEA